MRAFGNQGSAQRRAARAFIRRNNDRQPQAPSSEELHPTKVQAHRIHESHELAALTHRCTSSRAFSESRSHDHLLPLGIELEARDQRRHWLTRDAHRCDRWQLVFWQTGCERM
jgi:hypothetical protein